MQGNNHNIVDPRVTNNHWVDPYQFILDFWEAIIQRELSIGTLSPIGLTHGDFFYWLQGNNINRVVPRVTKAHWVYNQYF